MVIRVSSSEGGGGGSFPPSPEEREREDMEVSSTLHAITHFSCIFYGWRIRNSTSNDEHAIKTPSDCLMQTYIKDVAMLHVVATPTSTPNEIPR